MGVTRQADRDIVSRLGLMAHLETMRANGMGIENIQVDDFVGASPAGLRVWEDCNFPYRLPEDLRAFLSESNGFSLAWTARQRVPPPGGAQGIGEDVVVGRMCVDPLSAIKRVPLDADDLRDMTASRARATAAAAAAAKARSLPRRRGGPRSSSPDDPLSNGGERALSRSSVAGDTPSSGGANSEGGYSSAYGIAAFCLDSSCEVGRVALVYGGAPITGCIDDVGGSSNSKHRERRREGTKALATRELSSPEVWLQDLSCRWNFLADDFTKYFRMMVVHLGVRGWQQAFTPVGLSPNTEQCMRLYCPDRLLFDQLEWHTERANAKAARDVAAGNMGAQGGGGEQATVQTSG
eukprot:g1735.t1